MLKKIIVLIALLSVVVLFFGCTPLNDTKKDADADTVSVSTIVPLFGFSSSPDRSISRAIVGDTDTYADVCYDTFAPSLTGFVEVTAGVAENQVLRQNVLGVDADITVNAFTDGTHGITSGVRFSGELIDGSGTFMLELNTGTKDFYFEQCLFIDDPDGIMMSDPTIPLKYLMYSTLTGTLADDISCLASGSVALLMENGTEHQIQVITNSEMYIGAWGADGTVTGAGYTFLNGGVHPGGTVAGLSEPAVPISSSSINAGSSYLKAVLANPPAMEIHSQIFYRTSTDTHASVLPVAGSDPGTFATKEDAFAAIPSTKWKALSTVFN